MFICTQRSPLYIFGDGIINPNDSSCKIADFSDRCSNKPNKSIIHEAVCYHIIYRTFSTQIDLNILSFIIITVLSANI